MQYSKNHTVYINKDNIEVPSATTILKLLNKPALMGWANWLGFKRINYKDVKEESAEFGTLVHDIINHIITKQPYTINEKDRSLKLLKTLNNFLEWKKTSDIDPILTEEKFVLDEFGGTVDFYGLIDGKYTILDFKTSKDFRLSMFIQLALYCILLEANAYKVDRCGILIVNENKYKTKYIKRKDMDIYIKFAYQLIELFHLFCDINLKDGWNDLNQLIND